MKKQTFATLGIFLILILGLGLTTANTSSKNGVTLTLTPNAHSGDVCVVNATVKNSNGTALYINFENTGWASWTSGSNISSGDSKFFTGASSSCPETAMAEIYNASNKTQKLFTLSINSTIIVAPTEENTLCQYENYNETSGLRISNFNVDNQGQGSDSSWQYLDPIQIKVGVENENRTKSVNDVDVELVILDSPIGQSGNDITSDFNLKDDIVTTIGTLRSRNTETATFNIDKLPTDLSPGTYYMYVMAYGNTDNGDKCVSTSTRLDNKHYYEFDIESVDYDKSIVAMPSSDESTVDSYCGQKDVQVSFPVYNLGDSDEDRVLVNIYNSKLGIDKYLVLNNLDSGDEQPVTLSFDVPTNLTKDYYDLHVTTSFDWDSSKDASDPLSYDRETSDKTIRVNILSCEVKAPTINAVLESSSEIGKNIVVQATITNNGENSANFVVAPMDFDSWADLVSVMPPKMTIPAGASQNVLITLSPKSSGEQTFKVSVAKNGKIFSQPVSLTVAKKPGIFSNFNISGTTAYLLIAIIVMLFLILLIVIVRLARRPVARNYQS